MRLERLYLESVLRTAGYKSHIYTSMKELGTTHESYVAAILREGESFTRSGSKITYEDQSGARKKRRRLFERQTRLKVVIGDASEEKCEETFARFLVQLGKGTPVDGNWVDIEVGDADWVEDKDSILKAKIAVEFQVIFHGGIYKDSILAEADIGDVSVGHEEVRDNGSQEDR